MQNLGGNLRTLVMIYDIVIVGENVLIFNQFLISVSVSLHLVFIERITFTTSYMFLYV